MIHLALWIASLLFLLWLGVTIFEYFGWAFVVMALVGIVIGVYTLTTSEATCIMFSLEQYYIKWIKPIIHSLGQFILPFLSTGSI